MYSKKTIGVCFLKSVAEIVFTVNRKSYFMKEKVIFFLFQYHAVDIKFRLGPYSLFNVFLSLSATMKTVALRSFY